MLITYKSVNIKRKVRTHHQVSLAPVLCVCSWEQGPWTQCSVSCGEGGGWQDRSVLCVEEDSHGQFSQVEEWKCTHSPRPITRQICNTFACPQWVAMEWSQVSKCLFTPDIWRVNSSELCHQRALCAGVQFTFHQFYWFVLCFSVPLSPVKN